MSFCGTCARCEGRLLRERMYDLPRKIQEYFCLNCGERFWLQIDPPARPAEQAASEAAAVSLN